MAKKKSTKPNELVEALDVQIEELPVVDEDPVVEIESDVEVGAVGEDAEVTDDPDERVFKAVSPEAGKNSVWPLIIGGVVAGALGFVVARSNFVDNFLPPSWRINAGEVILQNQISDAQLQIDELSEKLAALSSDVLNAPQVDNSSVTDLVSAIGTLNARINEIENRPVITQDENGDFIQLREAVKRQQAEIDELLVDARQVEKTSQEVTSQTLALAAVSQIIAAIESGASFGSALVDLEATGSSDIPDVLKEAAIKGVVTLAALQESIPAAARAGLAASPQDPEAGLGGFLKRQLGARSIAPREGDDADAVLSRVEDAVRQGRLADALVEAEQLSLEAKSAMSDWLANTTNRLDIITAFETFIQRLTAN